MSSSASAPRAADPEETPTLHLARWTVTSPSNLVANVACPTQAHQISTNSTTKRNSPSAV